MCYVWKESKIGHGNWYVLRDSTNHDEDSENGTRHRHQHDHHHHHHHHHHYGNSMIDI